MHDMRELHSWSTRPTPRLQFPCCLFSAYRNLSPLGGLAPSNRTMQIEPWERSHLRDDPGHTALGPCG
ncbi:hypothetical protein AG1IA_05840 [Rhizoctonia solani AG-1 IA]|uniref:Uncharacterized protein n=1 Tax=Thanatephorus cucumeris (strain AG1-IA) TaxID=983506 RepID=L8WTM2_THACA|nr:hypothetical protein AG1IA_05840 [Rhizoctonia solani AG-1 IA]